MKITKYVLSFGLILIISACTSITTIPQIGDMQTVITNAKTENEAVKIANDRARRICSLQNQTIKIIDLDTMYQGVDSSQQALANLAQRVLPKEKTSSPYIPDGYTYKATLTFKCV